MTTTPGAGTAPRGDRRRERTRGAIMGAGQRLFAERSLDGVTIDDIVAEADVAKGSFYNHFDDKEGLASAILELVHGDCEFHILAANRDVGDPAARVARALCVMIAYAVQHPDRLQALFGLAERRRVAGSPLNAGIAEDVADGLGKERFTGVTVETGLLIATAIIGVAVGHVMDEASLESPSDVGDSMGSALLRALGVASEDASVLAHAAVVDVLSEELTREHAGVRRAGAGPRAH